MALANVAVEPASITLRHEEVRDEVQTHGDQHHTNNDGMFAVSILVFSLNVL